MRDLNNYGYGFHGWQAHLQAVVEALGGGAEIRKAVSKEFQEALRREQQRYAPKYTYPDWTEASEKDFDTCRLWLDTSLRHVPEKPVLATAPFNGVVLEFREDRVDLHGGDYHLMCGLVGSSSQIYDSRSRDRVEKWSPFMTPAGMLACSGSEYGRGGDAKSVTARSEATASTALRKLAEKHFKVSFTNVTDIAA